MTDEEMVAQLRDQREKALSEATALVKAELGELFADSTFQDRIASVQLNDRSERSLTRITIEVRPLESGAISTRYSSRIANLHVAEEKRKEAERLAALPLR